jgi:hypothetical protein
MHQLQETIQISNEFFNRLMNEHFEETMTDSDLKSLPKQSNYDFIDGLMKKSEQEKQEIQNHVNN